MPWQRSAYRAPQRCHSATSPSRWSRSSTKGSLIPLDIAASRASADRLAIRLANIRMSRLASIHVMTARSLVLAGFHRPANGCRMQTRPSASFSASANAHRLPLGKVVHSAARADRQVSWDVDCDGRGGNDRQHGNRQRYRATPSPRLAPPSAPRRTSARAQAVHPIAKSMSGDTSAKSASVRTIRGPMVSRSGRLAATTRGSAPSPLDRPHPFHQRNQRR